MIGTKLAHYEITGHLGTGGMGEVYQATDSTLGRSVAVKLLPEAFTHDVGRSSRFEREARVLASLNHPNIAVIHGIQESGGRKFLVMELVGGETLDEKIRRGALPLADVLEIATQLLDALESAHEKGVVHRDLKPANIKLTSDGKVKVLDFGLAKAFSGEAANPHIANSPTMSLMATQQGVILGTAAYMSPEQARGREVDQRTDIFAFGTVFYEMLTGHRAFAGEDVTDILGSVLKTEPDWGRLPSDTPLGIRQVLKLCLQKDAKKRLRNAGDVRIDLERAMTEPVVTAAIARPQRGGRLGWIVAGALAIMIAVFALWNPWAAAPGTDRQLVRLSVDLGPDAVRSPGVSVILSPDGTRIAFVGRGQGGVPQLYTRRLDQTTATPLAETQSTALMPFFSPKGDWIGFRQVGKIKKVSVQGGAPMTVGDLPTNTAIPGGASWGDDDFIYMGSISGLWRMPAAGGPLEHLNKDAPEKNRIQIYPHVLPGSKAVLFTTSPAGTDVMDVGVLDTATGKSTTVIHGGYWPQYLSTSAKNGHLVYVHDGTLFGVGFDPKTLQVLGQPAPLQEEIAADGSIGRDGGGQVSISRSGAVVYLSGRFESPSYPISWMDASGKTTPLVAAPAVYRTPRLSPDGKLVAYHATSGKGFDVWVYDSARGVPTQVSFVGAAADSEIAWAKDSKHLVYGDGTALWWTRADGSGQPQRLVDKLSNPRPTSFAPDGRLTFSPSNGSLPDIWTLPLDLTDPEHPRPGTAEPFLSDPALPEIDAAFSPDGKFIAYSSNESGATALFVRPFPGPGGKWQVSAGGKFPVWSAATHELLFLANDDRIMAASYSIQGPSFSVATARVWCPTPVLRTGVLQNFDVSPDGKRVVAFLQPPTKDAGGSLHATFLLNFFDDVRRKLPVGN
jgi:eukaryotic-like serine/threonine-protein kinase